MVAKGVKRNRGGEEMFYLFYLTTHSTYFIYDYLAS